ncbi:HEAT repeat-containing protein [Desulfomicrobium apsheronum]|uniref:HEAT repeat-containing protein n=1 Tax=Desulfomicrobium apsheronum TaxID=52560 RepID=A0A1I3WJT4_9BACT|nr:HEAT repeat domain-containing protein [Desulfomicrobium apsheronum]SFK07433.1 HEAT repeat-containing protein [Desulfomicrobium apsheronum]
MNAEESGLAEIPALMAMLAHKDGLIRKKGREGLEALGKPAVAPLCAALLTAKDHHVRWAAAKALGTLRDPDSAPALVDALEDRNSDVTWLAAVALENLGQEAWRPLLQALIDRGVESVALREGAHHVFSKQKAPEFDDLLDTIREALEFGELTETGGIAASEMLKRLRDKAASR